MKLELLTLALLPFLSITPMTVIAKSVLTVSGEELRARDSIKYKGR